jgi:hypothetical protein
VVATSHQPSGGRRRRPGSERGAAVPFSLKWI